MQSKYDDINAVIKKANALLENIISWYNNSLEKQKIDNDLLVEIKDFFGNLRSWLDYLWNKIWLENFPMCNSKKDLINKAGKLTQNILYKIELYQPYTNDLIKNFNYLNNKNKHLTLTPQKKTETRKVSVSRWGWSVSRWPWVKFWEWVSVMGVPIDPLTQLPIPNDVVKTDIINWIDFIFDNSDIKELDDNISVLPFLKKILTEIEKAIKEIETYI
jgi:hypothetical protein